MGELGKVDRSFFDERIYPHLGAEREDVVVSPQHGVDFGAIEVGGKVVVLATDPVFVMPSLGFERAAWFAIHILLADVAVSGIAPTHLSVDFNLPPEITDEQFATVWETFDREAREVDVSVVTGHTARYAGCNYPMVGGATSIAVGEPEDLVRPDGARPGDRVLVTKGPAIEATALLAVEFEELLREWGVEEAAIDEGKERFSEMSPVRDALVASAAGPVSAMHDATEGGVVGGLTEMARSAGVRIDVSTERIPIQPGVEAVCEAFGIDPWVSISEGTLLLTVPPEGVDDVLDALSSEGIVASEVGEVSEGSGLSVDGEFATPPERDPFWAAFERGIGERGETR
ncbi:AIR synthase family protein [Natronorarus salvus]|uniref:AIR synthase family protein n=1 Tax=Natronorarus salvus TaxID=3117733 RepID=UPI002F263FDC